MFFILSKTLSYLTMPLVWICIFFIVHLLVRKYSLKKLFFWLGFGSLIFFSNEFLANEVMLAWELDAVAFADVKKKYDYGIVLTGVTNPEKTPRDRVYFSKGADRVTHAVHLYKLGLIRQIIISGGRGRLVDIGEQEADELRDAMLIMGVPVEDIMTENNSRNTYESALEVKKILDQREIKPSECLLITSAFHMRRALACFKKAEAGMDYFTTDFYTHRRVFTPDVLFIPKVEAIFIWQRLFKEWIGFIAYKIAGYV
jgi:uncharacterized SAM-binding protein YcdF (DUF218 family)